MSRIVTRFAPSPTGFLHIGGARTALFNWLYARHHGGHFLLRIEDTDKSRNVDEAIQPIINGLAWLGIQPDGEITYQSRRASRHVEVANELIARGAAYRCYMSDEEVAEQKATNRPLGKPFRSRYRDNIPENAIRNRMARGFVMFDINETFDKPFVVRLRAPASGTITIDDAVQGSVSVEADTIDDLVLLRADGTPTYMLAVVVDDHDAGVNVIIRGDDHLSNAFRQLTILRGMDWPEPRYAHIPLIHDEAGKKLSKRTGAAGVEFYCDAGILPEAMLNYLLRLGWGHGDHETFTVEEAIRLFDLDGVGRAPSRLDYKRLEFLNGKVIFGLTDADLSARLLDFAPDLDPDLTAALSHLIRERSKTLVEAKSYIDMVASRHTPHDMPSFVHDLREVIACSDFTAEGLKNAITAYGQQNDLKLKHVMAPLRLALMGSKVSPPLFEVMVILGLREVMARLDASIYFTNNIS